jgi:leucyl-tRNA synthetase
MAEALVEIAVQINGKVRDHAQVPPGTAAEALQKAALALPRIRELTAGKRIVKVVAIPNRLVNIVVAES